MKSPKLIFVDINKSLSENIEKINEVIKDLDRSTVIYFSLVSDSVQLEKSKIISFLDYLSHLDYPVYKIITRGYFPFECLEFFRGNEELYTYNSSFIYVKKSEYYNFVYFLSKRLNLSKSILDNIVYFITFDSNNPYPGLNQDFIVIPVNEFFPTKIEKDV